MSSGFASDQEMFHFIKQKLYVAAICDILDMLGFRHQAMHPRLRPLLSDMNACGFVGRARTLRWMETDYVVEDDPYGCEIDAIDSLRPGDVAVHSTDRAGGCAPWGELMATLARRNGAAGCVCDGMVRDATRIVEMGFPVYCAGFCPLDSKGRARVMAYDVPVSCGDVLVEPGCIIFADFDGVVVIPTKVEADVLRLAHEKIGKENVTRRDILDGASLREVYDRYGVL